MYNILEFGSVNLSLFWSYSNPVFFFFQDYLHTDLDLGPLSASAPQKSSPLHVDPLSGVYIGIDEEVFYTSNGHLQFSAKSLNGESEEAYSEPSEEYKVSSPALKKFKKKLLTMRSCPNLIRKQTK